MKGGIVLNFWILFILLNGLKLLKICKLRWSKWMESMDGGGYPKKIVEQKFEIGNKIHITYTF